MPYLLYYRGKGKGLMSNIQEYVVLLDIEELTSEDKEDNRAPDYGLHKSIQIDDDITDLPTDRILAALY